MPIATGTALAIGGGLLAGTLLAGGSSQTTTTKLSREQKGLIAQQTELGEFQLEELRRQRIAQGGIFDPATFAAERTETSLGGQPFDFSNIPQTAPTALAQPQITPGAPLPPSGALPGVPQPGALPGVPQPGAVPGASQPGAIPGIPRALAAPGRDIADPRTGDILLDLQLKRLRSGGEATPQDIALVNRAVSSALASGETDIKRFQSQATEQLREELAPQLGLRTGDTPILDRGGRITAEAARQQGQLVSNLRGQAAETLLNFPLQRATAIGGLTQAQQALAEQGLQFDTGLGETQRQFSGGLGLAGAQLAESQRGLTGELGLSAAQLAEQQRQFGTTFGLSSAQLAEQQRQFGGQLGLSAAQLAEQQRQFGGAFGEQQRQFTTGAQEGARQFDFSATEASRQFQEQQSQAIRSFQSQLQQQAFTNRLQLGGAQATAGLGLAGIATPNIGPALAGAQTNTTVNDPTATLGGIGGLLLGVGSLVG